MNRSVITLANLSKEKIQYLIRLSEEFERHTNRRLLEGKVVATLFFEPSTRTRLSFETAANRLGARIIGFTDPKVTSSTKGETLHDTIKMVSNYADVIVMRHFLEGAAQYASEITDVPIINAGDGSNQHPSQTMLDLYSIYKTQGHLDNLHIYLVGDLKYGRTVHSLLMAMRHFNPTFHFIAPKELEMPEEYKIYCEEQNIKYFETRDFNEDVIADADILFGIGLQVVSVVSGHGLAQLQNTTVGGIVGLVVAPLLAGLLHNDGRRIKVRLSHGKTDDIRHFLGFIEHLTDRREFSIFNIIRKFHLGTGSLRKVICVIV